MKIKKFWKLTNSVDSTESTLILDGPIASETWWGDEVTPQAFRDELKKITAKNLTVIIDSVGGDVWAGMSIYNALRELEMEVTVRVDGLAASIASVIAMAGEKIIMSPGSMMMVHKPSGFVGGNIEDLEKAIEMLQAAEESILPIYADRTGLSMQEVTDMVNAETWMSAEKAVELGFADEMGETIKKSDAALEDKAPALNFAFSMKATQDSLQSYLSKVKAKDEADAENPKDDKTPAEPVVPADPDPDKTPEPAPAPADEDKPPEPNGEPEPPKPVDPPTEPAPGAEDASKAKPTNSAKKEPKDMEDKTPEQIAASQVIEPADQAPVAPKSEKDYLKTKKSIEDFAHVLENNAGKTAKEVKDAWGQHLITMGITNPEILLPDALITKIEDAFEEGGDIWKLVNKSGLTVFRATRDTVTGENSRAAGYNRADEDVKREELITLADRVLRPQFIYKYITLNKEDIKENRDTGALVSYVLSELPRRIIREVERAIVIGDGRADGSDYKIDSFISLKDDAADNPGVWASQYDPDPAQSRYETLIRARALVRADGAKYLVAKADYLTELLLEQGVNGGYLFQPGTNLGSVFGFAGVIEPDWMDDDADNDAYICVFSAYTTVGDNSIEAYTNFLLSTNKQEYLQEIYAGGGLVKLKAAVAISETPAS